MADVVVTMVSDGAAARAVLAESGLLVSLRPGSVVLEMSTIGPTAVAELAAEAGRHGVHLLDAPVSGSVRWPRRRSSSRWSAATARPTTGPRPCSTR